MTRYAGAALVVVTMVLAACGDDEDSPPRPTSCDPTTQRVGTYLMSFAEVSGTCGPVSSQLVSLNPGAEADGCTIHSEVLSEGGCKLERTLTCVAQVRDDTQWGGIAIVTNNTTAVTYQRTQDGSRIEGTMTVALDNGRSSCRSTYSVAAVRQ
jgi:hypothetical protein